jgi:hypothetical protein
MQVDSLLSCLSRYRANDVQPKQRKKKAEIDQYIGHLHAFTMRRLESANRRLFSLQKLADEIAGKHGRRFHRSSIKRALERHNLYDLWG